MKFRDHTGPISVTVGLVSGTWKILRKVMHVIIRVSSWSLGMLTLIAGNNAINIYQHILRYSMPTSCYYAITIPLL